MKGAYKMFVLKRNQVIITALVLMIAVAGYLSWQDSRQDMVDAGYVLDGHGGGSPLVPDPDAQTFSTDDGTPGLIGAPWTDRHNPTIDAYNDVVWPTLADLDMEDILTMPANDQNLTEAGEAIFVDGNVDASFFVQRRLVREQSRSNERSILNDIINNANVEADQRANAADRMLDIQDRITRETAAEAVIKSKGFSEVYVRISDNAVDIIVNKPELTEQDLAQIIDVIKRKTGMNETQIHISPMRR